MAAPPMPPQPTEAALEAAAASIDERAVRESIGIALAEQNERLATLQAEGCTYEVAVKQSSEALEDHIKSVCSEAVAERDRALFEAVATAPDAFAAMECAERLSLMPSSLEYHGKRLPLKHLRAHVQIALVAFQDDLERTRRTGDRTSSASGCFATSSPSSSARAPWAPTAACCSPHPSPSRWPTMC
jgi:hypothetical protein